MSKKRLAILGLLIVILVPSAVYGLTAIGHQTLPRPAFVQATVQFNCSSPSLVNVTDPNPLLAGHNGTAVYGCALSGNTYAVNPAFTVITAGNVNASLSLPSNVTISLMRLQGVAPMMVPLSQAQCALGIMLSPGAVLNLPTGSYVYCESFSDPSVLVDVTASWFQV